MDTQKVNETIKLFSEYTSEKDAKLIEKSINEFSSDYAETNEIMSMLENIYDSKVTEIINALCKTPELLSNETYSKPEDRDTFLKRIAFLSPAELNPANYEKILKKKEMEEYKKNDVKSSSAFKCSKCKKSKCSVTQKQTRAGDEPATTFVTCLECGYSFSFN